MRTTLEKSDKRRPHPSRGRGLGAKASVGAIRFAFLLGLFLAWSSFAAPAQDRTKKNTSKALTNSFTAERLDEIEDACRAFSDRFVTALSDACDRVRADPVSEEAAREALRLKLHHCSSIYSIATGPNALSQLLNLVTVSTLGYIRWVKEGHATNVFGAGGASVEAAFTEIHEDIWKVAERFLTAQEVADLRSIIWEWAKNHPQDRLIAYMRFDDFAAGSGEGPAGQAAKGFFAQMAEANRNVAATRQFAERAFFYARRAPRLLQWQAERTSDAILENRDIRQALDDFHQTTTVFREIGAEIRRVDERYTMVTGVLAHVETILDRADQVGTTIQGALRESQISVQEINEASTNLNEMLNTANRFYSTIHSNRQSGLPAGRPPEPFDVRQYSAAATELARASHEMNDLVREAEGMISSPAWTRRLGEINNTTQQRINHASVRIIQIVIVFFALLALHSWFVHRLRGRHLVSEQTRPE
jgi:hypothetical protein